MPKIDGIAGSNAAPPREIKLQRATDPARESQQPANQSRPKDAENTETEQQASRPEPGKPASATPARPISSPFQARLNYDVENEDIYIEILSPRTGEVLQRLPPEDALEPLLQNSDGKPGTVLDRVA